MNIESISKSLNSWGADLIRGRTQTLHGGLLLDLLQTQVRPSLPLALAPLLPGALLPAQEDVVLLVGRGNTLSQTTTFRSFNTCALRCVVLDL